MFDGYVGHRAYVDESRWDRRRFLSQWRQIYSGDGRWVPPYHPALSQALDPARNPHIARMRPVFLHVEATPRGPTAVPVGSGRPLPLPLFSFLDEPMAAGIALFDPRRRDRAAHLALLHCNNDPASLRLFFSKLAEELWSLGCRRLIGPTGVSPYLNTGLLQDHWDVVPPLYTPYAPPYMPELVAPMMRPLGYSRLYHMPVPQPLLPSATGPARLVPLEPDRLAEDLLPLLTAACPGWADFPPPDEKEAAFLLRWLGAWPWEGWAAEVEGQPVGFVLLQPDISPRLRRARGGRRWHWRLWLRWASRRPARHGRLALGAVLPEWRRQGIGRQLLLQALVTAQGRGWESLRIGPLPDGAPGCAFLERQGGRPRQSYCLYEREL